MTADQILELLRTRVAVRQAIAAQALGVGPTAIAGAIARGAIPVVDLGDGARLKPIPTWWIRRQLQLD